MAETVDVALSSTGGDVTVEVIVTQHKPAGISVALYDESLNKEREIGKAATMEFPDPDVFDVASGEEVETLDGKLLGIFVKITSFEPADAESVRVISSLRQGGNPVGGGTVDVPATVQQGGGAVIIGYHMTV